MTYQVNKSTSPKGVKHMSSLANMYLAQIEECKNEKQLSYMETQARWNIKNDDDLKVIRKAVMQKRSSFLQ